MFVRVKRFQRIWARAGVESASVYLVVAATFGIPRQANLDCQSHKDLVTLLRLAANVIVGSNAFNRSIDILGRQAETSRVVLDNRLKVPGRRINRIRQCGDQIWILVEIVGVVVDHARFSVGFVIRAPRQLNVATTVKELAIGRHGACVPITSLVAAFGTVWRRGGGDFLIVLVSTRFPNGLRHKGQLTIERIVSGDIVDGIHQRLCGLLVAALQSVVLGESRLEIRH
jgi:hypothetical protein